VAVACLAAPVMWAAEYRGQVTFGGLPVPGATVTVTAGDKTFTAITDPQGLYSFPELADGNWTVEIHMLGFAAIQEGVAIGLSTPLAKWELQLLPLDRIGARVAADPSPARLMAPGALARLIADTPALRDEEIGAI